MDEHDVAMMQQKAEGTTKKARPLVYLAAALFQLLLVMAGIAMAIVTGAMEFGSNLDKTFNSIADKMKQAQVSSDNP
jgi:glutamate synthase domain-containing protein 2